jgi:hypothetical protein
MTKRFYTDIISHADVVLENETVDRVPVLDADKKLKSSTVTTTELETLSGINSNIQDQIDDVVTDLATEVTRATTAEAALDTRIDALEALDPMEYKGTWNATTNSPALADGAGDNGDVYRVSVAGTRNLGSGAITFKVGDKVVYNGISTIWEKWDTEDEVTSVNTQTGDVVLKADDINRADDSETVEASLVDLRTDVDTAQSEVDTVETNLNNHITDSADAHDASAISVVATGNLTSTNAQSALEELQTDVDANATAIANHLADGTDAHDASAISVTPSGNLSSTDVQSALQELQSTIDGIVLEAANVTYDNATSGLTATDVQAAIDELAARPVGSPGDIYEGTFSYVNNQAVAANITGLSFNNAVVRSFDALLSVTVDATTNLYQQITLSGVQRDGDWAMSIEFDGDDTDLSLTITPAGQIQYTSINEAGFVSGKIQFRAITTSV